MADLIDRQTAIETAIEAADKWDGGYSSEREGIIRKFFDKVPAVQPTCKPMYADVSDTISRQAAIDALKEKVFHNLTDEFYGAMQVLNELPSVQPDHNADVSKKDERTAESAQSTSSCAHENDVRRP